MNIQYIYLKIYCMTILYDMTFEMSRIKTDLKTILQCNILQSFEGPT